MALTCLRQVSANGILQARRRRAEELERKARLDFSALPKNPRAPEKKQSQARKNGEEQ
jgi:hypothetical protein